MKPLPPAVSSKLSEVDLVGSDLAWKRLILSWAHSQQKDQLRQAGSSRQASPEPNTGPEIRLLDEVIQRPHTLRSKESRSPHLSSVARHVGWQERMSFSNANLARS